MIHDKCRILLLMIGLSFIVSGAYFYGTSNFSGGKIMGISFIILGCFSVCIYAYTEFIPKKNVVMRPDISNYTHIKTSYDTINYSEELPQYVEYHSDNI